MVRSTSLLVLLSFAPALLALSWVTGSLAAEPQVPNLVAALEAQRQRVASAPSATAYNDLGNLLVLAERFDDAETAYSRAVDLAPAETGARFNLGVLYQQLGRGRDAQEQFESILAIDPGDAWAHYQLGVLLAGRKDRNSALEHYARALALDPKLSFAEVNPHIIDNKLFAEALLMSQRYSQPPGAGVARQYGEPDRIRALLLGKKTDDAQQAAATGTAAGDPEVRLPGARPNEASPESAAVASSDGAATAKTASQGSGAPGGTILVAPSATADTSPSAAPAPQAAAPATTPSPGEASAPPGRGAPGGRPTPPRDPRPTVGQPGSPAPPSAPLGGSTFRPSRRSSAQLELRLEAVAG